MRLEELHEPTSFRLCLCLRAAKAYDHAGSTLKQSEMVLSSASPTFETILRTVRFPRKVLPSCFANRSLSSLAFDTSTERGTPMVHRTSFIREFYYVKRALQAESGTKQLSEHA